MGKWTWAKMEVRGSVTREPEIKISKSGKAYGKIGIVVHHPKKDQSGNWENVPMWFEVMVFDQLAESLSGVQKKQKLDIVGELGIDAYKKQDGTEVQKWIIMAKEVTLAPDERGTAPATNITTKRAPLPKSAPKSPQSFQSDGLGYGDGADPGYGADDIPF